MDYQPAESNLRHVRRQLQLARADLVSDQYADLSRPDEYYYYYGDDFKVECPTRSGRWMNLYEVSQEIAQRLIKIFLPDEENAGMRPVFGGVDKFQSDPYWRDYLLFYEYFHGDNGAGIGASHQTGWTGLVANLIRYCGLLHSTNSASEQLAARAKAHLRRSVMVKNNKRR